MTGGGGRQGSERDEDCKAYMLARGRYGLVVEGEADLTGQLGQ